MQNNLTMQLENVAIESLKKLHEQGILPYPKYYNDIFMDLVEKNEAFDDDFIKNKSDMFFNHNNQNIIANKIIQLTNDNILKLDEQNKSIRQISSGIELSEIKTDEDLEELKTIKDIYQNVFDCILEELNKSDLIVKKLHDKLSSIQKDININQLTKIYNWTIFKNKLEHDLQTFKNIEANFYIALVDADNFKHINDTCGRIAGDKTLIYLAKTLQNILGEHIKIYHNDGTQFALMIDGNIVNNIDFVMKRVIDEISLSKLFYKGNNINLTVSIGLTKHKKNDTFDTIFARSKEALQVAKNAGKNCYKEIY